MTLIVLYILLYLAVIFDEMRVNDVNFKSCRQNQGHKRVFLGSRIHFPHLRGSALPYVEVLG